MSKAKVSVTSYATAVGDELHITDPRAAKLAEIAYWLERAARGERVEYQWRPSSRHSWDAWLKVDPQNPPHFGNNEFRFRLAPPRLSVDGEEFAAMAYRSVDDHAACVNFRDKAARDRFLAKLMGE